MSAAPRKQFCSLTPAKPESATPILFIRHYEHNRHFCQNAGKMPLWLKIY